MRTLLVCTFKFLHRKVKVTHCNLQWWSKQGKLFKCVELWDVRKNNFNNGFFLILTGTLTASCLCEAKIVALMRWLWALCALFVNSDIHYVVRHNVNRSRNSGVAWSELRFLRFHDMITPSFSIEDFPILPLVYLGMYENFTKFLLYLSKTVIKETVISVDVLAMIGIYVWKHCSNIWKTNCS